MKLFSFIISILLFIQIVTPTKAQEQIDQPPVISNITANSFTVSWFSNELVDESVQFGKTNPETWAIDDRGAGVARLTHHVTLRSLEPNTEYQFRIGPSGRIYRQRTAESITGELPPLPEQFKGKIVSEDNISTPDEAIVYLKVEGGGLVSVPMETNGEWRIRMMNIRTQNLVKYLKLQELNYVDFFVRSGVAGEATKKVFAYARENPIDFTLTEPQVPFYRINLPGGEVFQAEEATITDLSQNPQEINNNSTVETASNDGFFQTIWKRISEIW